MSFFPGAQFLRWRLRGLLKVWPQRRARGKPEKPVGNPTQSGLRIVYLFSGTYGDFVQVLRPLNRLAQSMPGCDLVLYGGGRYAREFASELPRQMRKGGTWNLLTWIFRPRDLLFTNAVGVYRVGFEFTGRFCARRAFGFRHLQEPGRGGYDATLPLHAEVRSFAEENLNLLDLAGIPALPGPGGLPGREAKGVKVQANQVPGDEPALGRHCILFHIGSAGLKRDFGLGEYSRLVLAILRRLEDRQVVVLMGPGDEDIALEVRKSTSFNPRNLPVEQLIQMLGKFEGQVLCFNSFLAHLCHYLLVPAIVIHRQAVPYGYDCSPLHHQVVLQSENAWDLAEVWAALESAESGRT